MGNVGPTAPPGVKSTDIQRNCTLCSQLYHSTRMVNEALFWSTNWLCKQPSERNDRMTSASSTFLDYYIDEGKRLTSIYCRKTRPWTPSDKTIQWRWAIEPGYFLFWCQLLQAQMLLRSWQNDERLLQRFVSSNFWIGGSPPYSIAYRSSRGEQQTKLCIHFPPCARTHTMAGGGKWQQVYADYTNKILESTAAECCHHQHKGGTENYTTILEKYLDIDIFIHFNRPEDWKHAVHWKGIFEKVVALNPRTKSRKLLLRGSGIRWNAEAHQLSDKKLLNAFQKYLLL